MTLVAGSFVGERFELVREEPAGAFYRAFTSLDRRTNAEVVLWLVRSVLLPTTQARQDFVESTFAVSATPGTHLLRIVDAGVDPFVDLGGDDSIGALRGAAFIALQPSPGQTLAERIARGRPAPDGVVAYLAGSLAQALDESHLAGLSHGYLRAADVLMAGEMPRLGGMGLWAALDRQAALTALRAESHLLAPEVRAGERPSPAADVYALGAILAEVALGVAPESAAEAAVLRDRLARERPRLYAALRQALAGTPLERPSSPARVAAQLQDLLPGPSRVGRSSGPARALAAGVALPPPTPPEDADTGQHLRTAPPPTPGERAPTPTPTPPMSAPLREASVTIPRAMVGRAPTPPPEDPDDLPFDRMPESATVRIEPKTPPLITFRQHHLTPEPRELPATPSEFARSSGQVSALNDAAAQTPLPRAGTPFPLPPPDPTNVGPAPEAPAIIISQPVGVAPRVPTVSPPTLQTRAWMPDPPRARRTMLLVGSGIALGLCLTAVLLLLASRARSSGRETEGDAPPPSPSSPQPAMATSPAPAPAPAASPLPPCREGMALVDAPATGRFCIDLYESPGAGRMPETGLTLAQAGEACARRGARLCRGVEWEEACRGERRASYPWGGAPRLGHCNLGEGAAIGKAGEAAGCVSWSGAHDMAGNVAEWVVEGRVRGGSALDGADGRCSRKARAPETGTRDDLGFRCCADPN